MDWRQLWSAQRLARLRRRHSVQLAAGALILLALAFAAGRWSAAPGQRQLELAQQAELIAQLQKELATAQVNSDVEQRTITALQATLAQQQRQLAALREEITIWRGLSDGTEGNELKVRSWRIWSLPQPERYVYRLVIQQRSAQGSEVQGSAQVELSGLAADGAEQVMPLAELSASHPQREIELRFNHFQVIEGELTLPPGFVPQQVQVVAASGSGKVTSRYPWIPESLTAELQPAAASAPVASPAE
ncbi:MAG: hypothetical protein RBS88_03190 [Spongiibacteraceae bacterium]|jgi:hypothetical protein|nr:hypothetical protein [Spongiibacteraceae bacterium]